MWMYAQKCTLMGVFLLKGRSKFFFNDGKFHVGGGGVASPKDVKKHLSPSQTTKKMGEIDPIGIFS